MTGKPLLQRFELPADRALALRAINLAGSLFTAAGFNWSPLNSDKLIAASSSETGLRDFGNNSFRAALDQLCESYNNEAALSLLGRLAMGQSLKQNLKTRLQLTEQRKRNPRIARQKIERPLFICGLPRTGTTILYEVLALDPALRAPLSWEVNYPCPIPNANTPPADDPRIVNTERGLQFVFKMVPVQRAIHPMGAMLPQECVAILGSNFTSEQFSTTCHLPAYRSWLLKQSMVDGYRWHQQFLQNLQAGSGHKDRRWLLKTPVHLFFLPDLFEVYPDAVVIQTHRAPLQVLRSVCSLVITLRTAFSNTVYPSQIFEEELEYYSEMLRRGIAHRKKLSNSQFIDIHFDHLKSDVLGVVDKIYDRCDMELTPETREKMHSYVQANPSTKHGKHEPEKLFDRYGLSDRLQDSADYFAEYCAHFKINPI